MPDDYSPSPATVDGAAGLRHNLPTHLTNIRQMWLELNVRDEKGKLLMVSGDIDAQGKLGPDSRMFDMVSRKAVFDTHR